MTKSFFGLLVLLILFTTYTPKFDLSKSLSVNIKKIEILNTSILDKDSIKKDLSFLYKKNLFFLDEKKIREKLIDIKFIDSFSIKKIYPNTIKLTIKEKQPIAILQIKKKRFYISSEGELLNFFETKKYENLPTVFGSEKGFHALYKDLKNINFPIEEIKSFYFFDSGRWDLIMIDEKIIKLPIEEHIFSLENFMVIKNQSSFDRYKIFDYRIKDQLILN